MPTKIVEVLAKILDGLNKNFTLEEVNLSLVKNKEFDQQTVGVAFSLVYDKVLSNKLNPKKRKKISNNFRILSEEEKDSLGLENYNYLMHLYNVGLLTSTDVETILEQVGLFPDNTVTKEDINWIILISLIDFNSEIPPGSRILLYSSDTIN
ncbi:MAG: DUF494 domain-containing protein [Bacteroidetes bacterium]|nr:DUF494 domain-containing protein [Bacteroidota bacterium]